MKIKPLWYGAALAFFGTAFSLMLFVFVSCSKKVNTEPAAVVNSSASNNLSLPAVPYEYAVGGNNHLATLGRVLFYDKNLSGDKSVSCGSCHQQAYGFADNKKFSTGANGSQTIRNTHVITKNINSRFWEGKNQTTFNDTTNPCLTTITGSGYNTNSNTLCQTVITQNSIFKNPISIPFLTRSEMNMDMAELCKRLAALPYYTELFKNAFKSDFAITETNIQTALGTFLDNITSDNSRFDKLVASGGTQFSADEMAGWNIFTGKGKCSQCHKPNNAFAGSPGQFEDIGLDLSYTDQGRRAISSSFADEGKFHVPPLKNISLTAPYMHDGRFRSLGEVINFFSEGVNDSPNLSSAMSSHPVRDFTGGFTSGGMHATHLQLTPTEKTSLLAFLNTLTDYTIVSDVRLSDPFKK
jgi:cytochrome c peroxidase